MCGSFFPAVVSFAYLLAAVAVAQITTCPDGSMGYSTIANINSDIVAEVTRVQSRGGQKSLYTYRICPNVPITVAAAPLRPLLGASLFICGDSGLPTSNCQFIGGVNQVDITKSQIANSTITDVRFQGITFRQFTGPAFSGLASDKTTVTLENCILTEFNSTFAVQQSNQAGQIPFSFQMFGGQVSAGSQGSIFSNSGGSLVLDGVTALNNTAMALVATSNQGVSMVRGVSVKGGSYGGPVFSTMNGGNLVANSVVISALTGLTSVFQVDGANSQTTVDNTTFTGLDLTGTPSKWVGVVALNNGKAVVKNSHFVSSTQMLAAASALTNGTITVSDLTADNIAGSFAFDAASPSSIILLKGGAATVDRLVANGLKDLTTAFFIDSASQLTVRQACVQNGFMAAVTYLSSDSTIVESENFLQNLNSSGICPDAGLRMAKEDPGSACFSGPGSSCSFKCSTFGTSTTCLAKASLTPSPSASAPINGVNGTGAPTLLPGGNGTRVPTVSNKGSRTLVPTAQGSGKSLVPSSIGNVSFGPATAVPSTSLAGSQVPSIAGSNSHTPSVLPRAPALRKNNTFAQSTAPTKTIKNRTLIPSQSPNRKNRTLIPSRSPFTVGPVLHPGPTKVATNVPSKVPLTPSQRMPSRKPALKPTSISLPSHRPSGTGTSIPTVQAGSTAPTGPPSDVPSFNPSSELQSHKPLLTPTEFPSVSPSGKSRHLPSAKPSVEARQRPSNAPNVRANTKYPTFFSSTGPTFMNPTINPGPTCDCRCYWNGSKNTPPIVSSKQSKKGAGSPPVPPIFNGGKNLFAKQQQAQENADKKRQSERQLKGRSKGATGSAHPVVINYDPCWYYCQWITYHAYPIQATDPGMGGSIPYADPTQINFFK